MSANAIAVKFRRQIKKKAALNRKAGFSKNTAKFDWSDERQSFGERLYQSLDYLAFKTKSGSAVAACETIEKIVAEREKYSLFRKFFPNEWQNSKASCFKTGYYENYSERVNEFFHLVNKNLFPLLAGWNDDPEMDFERFGIFPMNFDLCCDEIEPENLRASYAAGLLFYFRDGELWDFFAEQYNVRIEDLPEVCDRPDENLWRLDKKSEAGIYVELFELVDHSTGSPWLDTLSCRGSEWYEWNEDTIGELSEAYREATDLLERVSSLDDLFETRPKETLLNLISLWNEGKLPDTMQNKRRASGEKKQK